MSRVEHIGDATLYLGDCREVLPTLGKVDAVVTDPPYGIMKSGTTMAAWHDGGAYTEDQSTHEWDARPDDELLITVRNAAPLWAIWGGNYFAGALGDCRAPLVWDKKTGANYFADGELAFSNMSGTLRIFRHQWCGAFKDSERGDQSLHPTQKPVALMEWCLGFVPNARTILDPFMGSGTTGVACANLGRSFIGIEREPTYFDIACRRIAKAYEQPRLFDEPAPKPVQPRMFGPAA